MAPPPKKLSYFEDYPVGRKFFTSARTVTEADVVNYAGISGNWDPMHCDVEFAKTTRFGQRIVQGALTYSIAIGLTLRVPDAFGDVIANYGLDKMRFPQPVFINDTLRVEFDIAETMDHAQGGILFYRHHVFNQRDEIACTFTQRVLIKRRPS